MRKNRSPGIGLFSIEAESFGQRLLKGSESSYRPITTGIASRIESATAAYDYLDLISGLEAQSFDDCVQDTHQLLCSAFHFSTAAMVFPTCLLGSNAVYS